MWCSSAHSYVSRCQLSPVNARAPRPVSLKELNYRLQGSSTERDYFVMDSWSTPPVKENIGAYLLGTFLGLLFYGLSMHQTYRYCNLFPTDTKLIRLSVITVMFLETVHTVFTMHSCIMTKRLSDRVFFARRVSLIGPRYQWIASIAMLFFVAEVASSIAAAHQAFIDKAFWCFADVNKYLAAIFGSAVVGDTLLTGSHLLVTLRNRVDGAQSMADVVRLYAINTGLFHGILNLVSLGLALGLKRVLIHTSVSIVSTRLYANTLLAVLSSRKVSASRDIEVFGGGDGMNVIARANRQAAQEQWNVPQVLDDSPPVIYIAVMTETASDKKTLIADIGRAEEALLLQRSRNSSGETLARHMDASWSPKNQELR
ncbi:hypothetical protein C8Q74DRAFT_657464 [Fomes fomentarius]|nr:hypothetical protein C8Q74DRAFT_657464 [Fomes fomentarius]